MKLTFVLCTLQVMTEVCGNKPWMKPLAEAGSSVKTEFFENENKNKKEKK